MYVSLGILVWPLPFAVLDQEWGAALRYLAAFFGLAATIQFFIWYRGRSAKADLKEHSAAIAPACLGREER